MTPSLFKCPFPGCGLIYRRKEHLTRYAKSHSKTQSFGCPFCDRSFSRNDTLRHHVRSHHQNKELKSSRAKRACNYCRARRSKCDERIPCTRCFRQGRGCSYQERSQRGTVDQEWTCSRSSSIPRSEGIESSPCRVVPFVQAYFDNFHPKWPFLHPETFDRTREPAFLLQSVTMMGMWATTERGAQETAKELHHKLISCIYAQKDTWIIPEASASDRDHPETSVSESTPWPLATYQGILLQIIFSLLQNHSPFDLGLTPCLPEIPSQLLQALVHSCRKRNMFSYPSMLSQFRKRENPEVFVWVGVEEVKRFGLCLYRVCQCARLHEPRELDDVPDHSNRYPSGLGGAHLSLADLQFALPDSDELWHMTSGLAGQLAERYMVYENANVEENWISQTAWPLQSQDEGFRWI